ncbi:MAG: serpin family protein [Oscillospiraceae bacterium]
MKRKLLALTLTLILGLTACSPSSGGGTKPAAEPEYPKALSFDDYEGRWARREEYPVSDAVWDSVSAFSARSASLALGGTEENALYSPVSLWFALALCAESAQGDTRAALLDALGLSGDTAAAAKALYNNLYQDNKMGTLKLASSLWVNQEFSVHQDFLERAAENFYAHSYVCDFSDPTTGKAMGHWLDEATGGLLGGQALETDPATLMTLFSALYYSDQWIDEFRKDQNTTGDFHNADGTVSQAEYMNRTYGSHGWQAGGGWLSTTLGLKNGGSMVFVLPDEGVTPGDLLADSETLAAILAQNSDGGWGEVVLQVPKFEVTDSLDLKDTVTGLGAGIVFDAEQADFSNLSKDALGLSSVRQEATLSIDEKGVTAAAYTQLDYAGAAPPDGRAELILDRPFLFFVTVSGAPLFVGVVNQL